MTNEKDDPKYHGRNNFTVILFGPKKARKENNYE